MEIIENHLGFGIGRWLGIILWNRLFGENDLNIFLGDDILFIKIKDEVFQYYSEAYFPNKKTVTVGQTLDVGSLLLPGIATQLSYGHLCHECRKFIDLCEIKKDDPQL